MYNGYGLEEYGYGTGATKSNSLHKNYRGVGGQGQYQGELQHHHGGVSSQPYHPSLDRRHFEQQQQQQQAHHSRSRHSGPYEMNDRHGGGGGREPVGRYAGSQMQPDFYFMPHQRKYSSDVARVFVEYGHNHWRPLPITTRHLQTTKSLFLHLSPNPLRLITNQSLFFNL